MGPPKMSRRPVGLPKKCASLREFNHIAGRSGPNLYMDINSNGKLEEFEYQEPLYLSHQEQESDNANDDSDDLREFNQNYFKTSFLF